MKLLVIGHSYASVFAQEKFVAMKAMDANLQLLIIVPPEINHFSRTLPTERHPQLGAEVTIVRRLLGTPPSTYLLDPVRLSRILRHFRPDAVLIEEDPHSVVGIEATFLTRICCPKAIITFFIWDNLARTHRFPLGFVKRVLTRYALSRTKLVICGNNDAQSLLSSVKKYAGLTIVLPQVGISVMDASKEASNDPPVIGFVGRLVPEKGLVLLLEALGALVDIPWRLVVIGSGPLEAEIQARWKPALGNRLTLRSAVPHSEVINYLQGLDIFVLPSLTTAKWKEQFGLTLAQAMMAGVACIGSSSGAIPEVLGPAGVIFCEGNRDELQNAIRTLLENPERRRLLGDAARKRAIQEFSVTRVSSAYLASISQILNQQVAAASSTSLSPRRV